MKAHGKETELTVGANQITTWTNASQLDRESDEHDITCYGADDYAYQGGLRKASFSASGLYDDAATGPHTVLRPLIGTVVTVVRKPEGTGTGKPTETFSALVKKYTESNPVAGIITWQCDFTVSGAIADTVQS